MARTLLRTAPIVDAQSVVASITSDPVDIQSMSRVSVIGSVEGGVSPTGGIDIQISNDGDAWVIAPGDNASDTIADNGSFFVMADVAAHWMRFRFNATSGTGSLTAYVHAIGF